MAHKTTELSPDPTHAVMTDAMSANDSDALTGHFVDVVGGEFEGKYGVLDCVASVDEDNRPINGIVITRDDDNVRLIVPYEHLRRATSGRR